jgi:hypothetical protein
MCSLILIHHFLTRWYRTIVLSELALSRCGGVACVSSYMGGWGGRITSESRSVRPAWPTEQTSSKNKNKKSLGFFSALNSNTDVQIVGKVLNYYKPNANSDTGPQQMTAGVSNTRVTGHTVFSWLVSSMGSQLMCEDWWQSTACWRLAGMAPGDPLEEWRIPPSMSCMSCPAVALAMRKGAYGRISPSASWDGGHWFDPCPVLLMLLCRECAVDALSSG